MKSESENQIFFALKLCLRQALQIILNVEKRGAAGGAGEVFFPWLILNVHYRLGGLITQCEDVRLTRPISPHLVP